MQGHTCMKRILLLLLLFFLSGREAVGGGMVDTAR